MGKNKTQTQNVNQQQSGQASFANQQFMQQLQQELQQYQQYQQQQQQQQQTGQQTSQQAQQFAQQQAQQQQTGVDAGSQAYIDQMRQQALGSLGGLGAAQFAPSVGDINRLTGELMDPYQQQVIGGVGQQFDRLRQQAGTQTDQQAVASGAFGGSRHGVATGQRLSELDRAQSQQVGDLLSQGFGRAQGAATQLAGQQAMAPAQAAMAQQQLLAGGLGPTGQVTTGTGTTTGTQEQQAQQQQQMQMLSNLFSQMTGQNLGFSSGQQFGSQSGTQKTSGQMTGKNTTKEGGGLFGDILGGVLALGSMYYGGGK